MTVKEIMKRHVATCAPRDEVATAARIMHEGGYGFVPVVDSHGSVVGVVTDRDLCLTVALHAHRPADRIAIQEVMSHPVFSCFPDEDLTAVLVTMANHHVRRLPVLDQLGRLRGVLSIDDIAQVPRRQGTPTAEQVADALKGICAPGHVEAALR